MTTNISPCFDGCPLLPRARALHVHRTKENPLGVPSVAQYQLRVHLYQARGLPAS